MTMVRMALTAALISGLSFGVLLPQASATPYHRNSLLSGESTGPVQPNGCKIATEDLGIH